METYPAGNFSRSLLRSKATGMVGTQDVHMERRDFLHEILTWKVVPTSLALMEVSGAEGLGSQT